MNRRATFLAAIALAALGVFAPPSAQAKYVMTFQELGADVIEIGNGTIDLTDLTSDGAVATNAAFVHPNQGIFDSGAVGVGIQGFAGAAGPASFGPGATTLASSSSGDGVALSQFGELFVPAGYASGSSLSETSTYLGATLASLGMTPGEYLYRWGSGDHFDTLTLNIGVVPPPLPIPEPSTWAMMLLGFAGLGYAAVRRKGGVRTISA